MNTGDEPKRMTLYCADGTKWSIKIEVLSPEEIGKDRVVRIDLSEPFTIPAGPCILFIPAGEWNYAHTLDEAIKQYQQEKLCQ